MQEKQQGPTATPPEDVDAAAAELLASPAVAPRGYS
jgi:hypothetical protein